MLEVLFIVGSGLNAVDSVPDRGNQIKHAQATHKASNDTAPNYSPQILTPTKSLTPRAGHGAQTL